MGCPLIFKSVRLRSILMIQQNDHPNTNMTCSLPCFGLLHGCLVLKNQSSLSWQVRPLAIQSLPTHPVSFCSTSSYSLCWEMWDCHWVSMTSMLTHVSMPFPGGSLCLQWGLFLFTSFFLIKHFIILQIQLKLTLSVKCSYLQWWLPHLYSHIILYIKLFLNIISLYTLVGWDLIKEEINFSPFLWNHRVRMIYNDCLMNEQMNENHVRKEREKT